MVLKYPTLFFHDADGDHEDDGDVRDDDVDIGCNKLMNSHVESSCSRGRSKTMLATNTRGTCNTRLQGNSTIF